MSHQAWPPAGRRWERGRETLIGRLASPPAVYALLILFVAAFLLLELHRSYPFADDSRTYDRGDDWFAYRQRAASVLHDGWRMPAVAGSYARPAGFLYIYFLAGVFRLVGENAARAYVVQSALLGLSAALMYLVFRRRLSPAGGLLYLGALALFLYLDAFRHYTNRLLSENLLVFLLPVVFGLLLRTYARRTAALAVATGLALGAAILTRPNIVAVAPALGGLLAWYCGRSGRAWRLGAGFLVGLLGAVSFLVARDYAVTGEVKLALFTSPNGWEAPAWPVDAGPLAGAWAVARYYAQRALFSLGFLPVLVAEYRVRPHWFAMWAGVLLFVGQGLRRPLEFWEAAALAWVVGYMTPLVGFAQIANYGFRMLVPVVPVALLLAVRAGDVWWARRVDQAEAASSPSV